MFETNNPLKSENHTQNEFSYTEMVYGVHDLLNDPTLLMAFTGHFDHLLTTLILINIKNKLSATDGLTGVEKKVYSVLVECIENVSKHSIIAEKRNLSTVYIGKTDFKYIIVTGNYIPNNEVDELKQKLEKAKASSLQELKQMYREQILSKRSDENNAGLGIIDMAIKTGNQIKYNFKPATENTSFYLLQTEINIQK